MNEYIENRVHEVASYIIFSKQTVRKTAKIFGVSKSTVYKDVAERLPKINPQLAKEVSMILAFNKAERNIRGGEATRMKYLREART
jgi:putative DeoR family transcriptional regulator (stage III sporulation protein D)